MIAVKTNTEAIHKAIHNEEKYGEIFQPFITELLKNDFTTQDRWKQIRDLVYNGNLDEFLLNHVAKHNEYFSSMPVKHSEKLRLIDLNNEFDNYTSMKFRFKAIEDMPLKFRAKINSFYIDSNNELHLNDNYLSKLKEENTTYLNEKQYEIWEKANEILKQSKELQEKSGVNIFRSGFVVNTQYGNLATSNINILYIQSLQ